MQFPSKKLQKRFVVLTQTHQAISLSFFDLHIISLRVVLLSECYRLTLDNDSAKRYNEVMIRESTRRPYETENTESVYQIHTARSVVWRADGCSDLSGGESIQGLRQIRLAFSEKGYRYIGENLYIIHIVLAVFLIPAFLFAFIYKRIPNLRGGGIPTSIGILRGIIPFKWVRNLIGIFGMSLVSFIIGVPLGNEGPSVQMGVAIGRGSVTTFGKRFHAWDRYSMTGGACSGFAVASFVAVFVGTE